MQTVSMQGLKYFVFPFFEGVYYISKNPICIHHPWLNQFWIASSILLHFPPPEKVLYSDFPCINAICSLTEKFSPSNHALFQICHNDYNCSSLLCLGQSSFCEGLQNWSWTAKKVTNNLNFCSACDLILLEMKFVPWVCSMDYGFIFWWSSGDGLRSSSM